MTHRWVPILCLVGLVLAQNGTDASASDPILQYRPIFARSLPVQLLVNGIVLTLMSVLLLQLAFTAQYHFRLAPVNFSLQVSAVCTLLVSSISTLQVIMSTVSQESQSWPYMLNYVEVNVPPNVSVGWTVAERAAWLLMTATTGMLIQLTHIQFLTLLFPSTLERRLIFALLGPLAITSATMQLIRIRDDMQVQRIALAVQNICNAALSLLFTGSLFFWGLIINRKNAWRTDGGTAAFGVGALTLAPMSSAISLLYIPSKEQFTWLKPLMWSVILWQSFLGWWWWVGAGMGVGELDELLNREEKRQRKRKRRLARRKVQRERAETIFKGMAGAFGFKKQAQQDGGDDEQYEPSVPAVPGGSSVASSSGGTWQIFRHTYNIFMFVRREHLVAAREQAADWIERVNEVYGREGADGHGWGLGQYGTRRVGDIGDNETVVGVESDMDVEVDVDVDKVEKSMESKEEDEVEAEVEVGVHQVRRRNRRRDSVDMHDARERQQEEPHMPASFWWWGPLRRWRLQDTTEYR